jgi:uncharacterized protein (TIGR00369 family)
MTTSTNSLVLAGAEMLVRVRPGASTAERAGLTVGAGPWLRDPVARYVRGALAVPLDDVTGHLVASRAPTGRWPVSLGIRIDFLADPPVSGPPMEVTGELIAQDEFGGTTRGTVTDSDGRILALVVQRSHLVPIAEPPAAQQFPAPPDDMCVRDALGIREQEPGTLVMPPTVFAANGMGNVHGGVLICGAELAAMSATGAAGETRTTSIDIAYIRPGDAAGTTTFRARVVHRGRSLAVVRVTAVNASNKPCAVATVVLQEVRA